MATTTIDAGHKVSDSIVGSLFARSGEAFRAVGSAFVRAQQERARVAIRNSKNGINIW